MRRGGTARLTNNMVTRGPSLRLLTQLLRELKRGDRKVKFLYIYIHTNYDTIYIYIYYMNVWFTSRCMYSNNWEGGLCENK